MLLDPLLPEATVQATLDRLPPDALFTASGDATFTITAPVFSVTSQESLDPLIAAGTIAFFERERLDWQFYSPERFRMS